MIEKKKDMDYRKLYYPIILANSIQIIGMHSASVNGVHRDEFKTGWNKGLMELNRITCVICEHYHKLPEDCQQKLLEMLADEAIYISCFDDDKIRIDILVNDTFYYATSDSESIETEDLLIIHGLWEKFGYDGLVAWVSKKRGVEPLKEAQTNGYRKALCDL